MSELGKPTIKICGVTRPKDALRAAELGAHAIGLNFAPTSKRRVAIEAARSIAETMPASVVVVGVFVESPADAIATVANATGIRWLQLHFDATHSTIESLARRGFQVIRAFGWSGPGTGNAIVQFTGAAGPGAQPHWLLVDAPAGAQAGGTGTTWDWSSLAGAKLHRPWLLAGGLTPDNVAAAVAAAHPDGVDVASGIESAPGLKDDDRLRRFIDNAMEAYSNAAS